MIRAAGAGQRQCIQLPPVNLPQGLAGNQLSNCLAGRLTNEGAFGSVSPDMVRRPELGQTLLRAAIGAATLIAGALSCAACTPVDYGAVALPSESPDPVLDALRIAYPDLRVSPDGQTWSVDDEPWRDIGQIDTGDQLATLESADLRDQFRYVYPLDFDLAPRKQPFHDPGRPRNDAFFRALYGHGAAEVQGLLTTVGNPDLGPGRFAVTTRRGVDCQLSAALAEIAVSGADVRAVFRDAGGGFNWRRISGTQRLSAHSFGIAIDINAEIGQYWRWAGEPEGRVGAYENRVPEPVVRAMERYGFIWGGKWHHYDGMHFEYRPALIVHARILGRNAN